MREVNNISSDIFCRPSYCCNVTVMADGRAEVYGVRVLKKQRMRQRVVPQDLDLRQTLSSEVPNSFWCSRNESSKLCIPYNQTDRSSDAKSKDSDSIDQLTSCQEATNHRTLRLAYQHPQYDECLNVYITPIIPDDSVTESLKSCILFYNLGLAQVLQQKTQQARRYFELSLVKLRLDSFCSKLTTQNLLRAKVHHNIGNCLYRTHRLHDALTYYKLSLANVKDGNLGAYHTAVANYGIAAMILYTGTLDEKRVALVSLQISLEVFQTRLGKTSDKVATVLHSIGRAHYLLGDFDLAYESYTMAVSTMALLSCGERDDVNQKPLLGEKRQRS
jgi:tetratricopeptide (TPR) repeat protein